VKDPITQTPTKERHGVKKRRRKKKKERVRKETKRGRKAPCTLSNKGEKILCLQKSPSYTLHRAMLYLTTGSSAGHRIRHDEVHEKVCSMLISSSTKT